MQIIMYVYTIYRETDDKVLKNTHTLNFNQII
jgi:hypothetical protein